MSTELVIELPDGVLTGRRTNASIGADGGPLIVALHGGGYSSAFFDIAGYSLLDRAAAAGCRAVALDRPGYGGSPLLAPTDSILRANAEQLDAAIAELWRREEAGATGVVLVGHSIGSAITLLIAAARPVWPLLGVAVSGVGLSLPPGGPAYEETHPSGDRITAPNDVKDRFMFGRPGSYPADAPAKAAAANAPVVYREVFEINTQWPQYAEDVCGHVRVPVHYRQGEHDAVWAQGADQLERFRQAFTHAPSIDAGLVEDAAHVIDFHNAGAAFQHAQVAFAIACAKA